ncbi:MAG: hypothetical protein RSF67_07290, partial [Clostridia bacterium]
YETKNANYGYEILKDGIPLKVVVNKKDPTQIGNKQVLVKLSGYVWEDILFGKTSKRNDLFKDNDYDINDNLMKDITVRLKDKSGNIVKNKDGKDQILKTGEKGEYQFVDVLIDQLTNYVVEFEYDGLVYTNVIVHNEVDNGSKSAESIAGRNDFNMKFSSVENKAENLGQTRDDKNNIAHDNLNYIKNSEEYKST